MALFGLFAYTQHLKTEHVQDEWNPKDCKACNMDFPCDTIRLITFMERNL